jgi:hypothetical protein
MKNIIGLVGFLALGLSTSVFAEGSDKLDLVGLKAKCAELTQNSQLKPFKIQVTCRQEIQQWRLRGTSEMTLPNSRTVGGSLRMKSYDVAFVNGTQPIVDSTAPCPVLEKWKSIVPAVDLEITCDELNPIESISDYCVPIIEARIQVDQSIVTEVPTGEIYDGCKSGTLGRDVTRS